MTQPDQPRPLDVDGIFVVSVGTAIWAVLLVLSLIFTATLRRHGHLWWIAAAACGFGLGLLGVAYCVNRRRKLGDPVGRPPES